MQTYDAKKEKKTWALKDVIFLAVIGIFFGIIYQVWSYAYYAMAATPLKPFAIINASILPAQADTLPPQFHLLVQSNLNPTHQPIAGI